MKTSIAGAIGLILGLITQGFAQDQGDAAIPRDSVVFGRTYGDWAAAWEQWSRSIPVTAHPLFDTADCSAGQTGPVFFLGGKFCLSTATSCTSGTARRSCTVPAGKALFFPVVNGGTSVSEEALPGNTDPECLTELPNPTINCLRRALQDALDKTTNLAVVLDGEPTPNLQSDFRVQSPVFDFTLPTNNNILAFLGEPLSGGTYEAAAEDGVFVMLPPLGVGQHTLNFTGTFPQFSPPFVINITYHLCIASRDSCKPK